VEFAPAEFSRPPAAAGAIERAASAAAILMTSIAFIMGVLPLASGRRRLRMRQAMARGVSRDIGVTASASSSPGVHVPCARSPATGP